MVFKFLLILVFVREVLSNALNTTVNLPDAKITTLTCSQDKVKDVQCIWSHNGNNVSVVPMKYNYEEYPMDGDCTLVIFNASSDTDGGWWQCSILTANETIYSKEMELNFEDIVVLQDLRVESNATGEIEEGQALELRCLFNSSRNLSVTWKRCWDTLDITSKIIVFSNISRNDMGNYTCTVSNEVGYKKQASLIVEVKFGPEIEMIDVLPGHSPLLHKPAVLLCHAKGNPPPCYSWSMRKQFHSAWEIVAYDHEFVISDVQYYSQGYYICNATSVINGRLKYKESRPIFLDVVGPPDINRNKSSNTKIQTSHGSMVNFAVYYCSDPGPFLAFWVLSNGRLLKSTGRYLRFTTYNIQMMATSRDCFIATLTIKNTKRHDSGLIKFFVSNKHGTERYQAELFISGFETGLIMVVGIAILLLLLILGGSFTYMAYKRNIFRRRRYSFPPPEKVDLPGFPTQNNVNPQQGVIG